MSLAYVVVVSVQADDSQTWGGTEPSGRSHFKLPELFDFEGHKRLLRKSYAGFLEGTRIAKLFMARAFRVFITANKHMDRDSKG